MREPYSYAELVTQGKQLAPIYTGGVDTIQIYFSEAITHNGSAIDGSEFTLYGTGTRGGLAAGIVPCATNGFNYNSATNVVTLTFATLAEHLYRIDLESAQVAGLAGQLDGEWSDYFDAVGDIRYDHHTLDDPTDDLARAFPSGNGISGGSFQFKFALLAGDYNQNGYVDAADYTAWHIAETFGVGDADGNGDGVVDFDDYGVWTGNLASALFSLSIGDYDHDGKVGITDYLVWRFHYSETVIPGSGADGSHNGYIDAADYVAWAYWRNTYSAWWLPPNNPASVMSLIDSEYAPRVLDVIIGGFYSAHDPFSFGDLWNGEQLRTVPVGAADTISIVFSENVNIEASYLRVVGYNMANVPTLVDFSYDAETFTATWRFENLTANDNYIISLSDAVTNTQGYRLDGEWGNPGVVNTSPYYGAGSTFPSGDGHAGGDFNFVVTLLAGDANRDGYVDETDYDIIQSHLDGSGGFEDGDFNGDGVIDATDMAIWELNQGLSRTGGVMLPSDLAGEGGWDWRIDDQDLAVIAAHFGMTGATRDDGDITGDGVVDVADLDFLMAQYGFTVQMNI